MIHIGPMVLLFLAVASCWTAQAAGRRTLPVVPLPAVVEIHRGSFRLSESTCIRADQDVAATAELLAGQLRKTTRYSLPVISNRSGRKGGKDIFLSLESAPGRSPESYTLMVSSSGVAIRASGKAGLFYGTQTLLQLLPPQVLSNRPEPHMKWTVPAVRIEDQPRFPWRGFMLDVSRHFFTKDEVRHVLDLMALHKLNMLQLHLVDGVGWRVEIKKYPRLTEVGAWRKGIGWGLDPKSSTAYREDGWYGGYYTQQDVRELVAYAADRHITIVPEIEMPGHCRSAMAAYPEFSCSGQPNNTEPDGTIVPGVYCPGKEQTFRFLEDVLGEIVELFPGKYVHIGGDEVRTTFWEQCPLCQARMKSEGLKNPHELQSYLIGRIERFLASKDRTLVGWSEIAKGGLAENAVVMDWIGGGLEAASAGHDVVMSPQKHCYLDYYQSTNRAAEPPAFDACLPLEAAYGFEPIPPSLPVERRSHILGLQGNLWTEHVASMKHAEYMMFPRLSALAEVGWSPEKSRDYAAFLKRLKAHLERLNSMGVTYRKLDSKAGNEKKLAASGGENQNGPGKKETSVSR